MKNINIMKNIHSFIKSNCGIVGISSVSRRFLVLFITLLSLGVGQVWAEDQMGFENSDNGVKFSKSTDGGSSYSDYQVSHGRTNTTQDGGSVTNLYLKEYFVYLYQNVDKLTGTTHVNYWFYRTNIGKGESSATQFGGNWGNWKVDTQDNNGWKDGWRHPKFGNSNISNDGGTTNVNLLSGQGSGHYTFEYYFDAETNGGWGTLYCNNTNATNFKVTFTYNIVPAVSSYSYSTDGSSSILSGSGSSEDPYIISYNGSLKITQSGSKASADANSEPYYKFGDGAYGTTAYTTISNITSTSKTSIEVKMKYYNSTDDLSGTESTATIYYKAEPAYSVTINNDGHGTTSPSGAQSNVGQVSGIAISATPSTNYEFVNWTITSGTGTFAGGGTTSTSASTTFYPTSAASIQANFRSTATISLTVSAGTHVTTVSGSQDPVTLGSKNAINATAFETGYTFHNWTASPAANAVFDDANSASTNVTVNNGSVTVTANAREIMHTVSITGGTGSSSVGIATKATVTANTAAEGKKFDHWDITGTYTLQDATTVNSREIHFTATSDVSLTAVYADRASKTVYFARPSSWTDGLKVYAWQESTKDGSGNPSNKNAAWPGAACTSTTTIKGTTYHYYTFYVDDNGEGDNLTAQNSWDKIIFSDEGNSSEKTSDLTIADGHFYHKADGNGENNRNTATVSGSASAEDWYVCGYWNSSTHDWGFAHPINLDGGTSGNVTITGLTTSTEQQFKIYRASTDQWFKWTGGPSTDYNDNKAINIGEAMILRVYNSNRNTFTALTTDYVFTLDITSTSNPVLTVAPNDMTEYSATLSITGHGSLDKATGTIQLKQYVPTTITATPEPGYRFKQWNVTGSVTPSSTTSATATFTATAAGGTIEAEFTNEGFIYFDRSAVSGVWSGSNVYFTIFNNDYNWFRHNEYDQALIIQDYVNNAVYNKRMNQIPNTNIYYYDISGYSTYGKIIFTDKSQPAAGSALNAMACAPRGDFQPTQNNMFVVENYVTATHNSVGEFDGYWMKYNETGSGIKLRVYNETGSTEVPGSNIEFTTTNAGDRQFTASISLSGTTAYKFKLQGLNDMWYGNNGTMTASNSTAWDFWNRTNYDCHFTTTGAGAYKFTLVCTNAGVLKVSLEFPLDVNDYRIVYNGKINTEAGSAHAHPSDFIRNVANGGSGEDIVSFFVTDDGSGEDDWSLTLQKCTAISGSTITWADACTSATLYASNFGLSGKTGVYTFKVKQNAEGTCDGGTITDVQPYTGDYYIRTDVAGGGWEAYETTPDNKLEFSSYSKEHSGYDYYYCHWTPTNKNIHFTIANDYSPCITDTFKRGEGDFNFENLPYQASVRFMYNSETNVIGRVYLNGSNEGETEYLSLRAMNDSIRINENTAIEKNGSENHLKLQDMGNWIYQKDIQAKEGTHYRLISNYRYRNDDHLQYFKGSDGTWNPSTTELLIGGSNNTYQTLRIVYDFKTNHLVAAWLVPESGESPRLALETNVMILQQNQDTARQITFAGTDALTEIDTVYSTVHLTKDFMQNTGGQNNSEAARKFFYVSFPYDVDLSDVFGSVGEYGIDWAIQWYDGKKRAREGFWADSEPNWKFFETAKGSTLRAYEGYVLTLNLNKFLDDSKWKYGVTDIYLYFPSKEEIGTIHNEDSKTVRVMPDGETTANYTCTINRATPDGDRRRKDSHWHCIGSPSFARNNTTSWNTHNGTSEDWKTQSLPFLYEWNSATNTMAPVAAGGAYKFKPLTAYLVQYEGPTITWTNVVTPASSIVARRAPESPDKEVTFTLSLLCGEEKLDQTFVRMSENEAVTSGFEFGQDLCKEFQRGANIYTIVENTEVAGNSLPFEIEQTTIVPVGVRITTAGEYTFAMPEGTNGVGVTLIDNATGARTSLAALGYTVSLNAGEYNNRFALEISPIQNTPTGIEPSDISYQPSEIRKIMIDGILYIVRDGKMYDARGTRVK